MIIDLDSEANENSGDEEIVNDFARFENKKVTESDKTDDNALESENQR